MLSPSTQVVGVDALRGWDGAVCEAALAMFRWQAAAVAGELGGTLVELRDGVAVAAFAHAVGRGGASAGGDVSAVGDAGRERNFMVVWLTLVCVG